MVCSTSPVKQALLADPCLHKKSKIMTHHINIVTGEHHYLPTCPCRACVRVRANCNRSDSPSGILKISPKAAHLFGLIKTRQPSGSVARELSQ